MITYRTGNLMDASAEALVNTVNEVGVMGKGIALMFKDRFPDSSRTYIEASKAGNVRTGKVLVTETGELFPKWVIHFPTKKHWRHPSKLQWIIEGLEDLVRVIKQYNMRSIALPPLGCGNGGLQWDKVRPKIEAALSQLPDVDVTVYEPTFSYQNVRKTEGVEKLTPARALIAELVRRYSILGIDCSLLEVHKLAYLLQETVAQLALPDPLDLRFAPNKYGPYADRLRHLLNGLDGSYLHAEKRVADASPSNLVWFEDSRRAYVEAYLASEARDYLPALEQTSAVIDGFESPLGLEALGTVHWLVFKGGVPPQLAAVKGGLASWPGGPGSGERKLRLFDDNILQLALDRVSTLAA